MKKNPKKQPKRKILQKWAKSMAEAARLIGLTRQTLSNYRKAGCEAFKDNGRVNLAELEAWMALQGREAGRLPSDLGRARVRLLKAQAERVEYENKIRLGQLVDINEISMKSQTAVALILTALERIFGRELPPALKGRDEKTIEIRCLAEIDRLKEELSEKFSALARPDAKQPAADA